MKYFRNIIALGAFIGVFGSLATVRAQIFNTGPAGLARQMPNIYGPYLANISRVRILEKRRKGTPSVGSKSKPPAGKKPTTQPGGTPPGGTQPGGTQTGGTQTGGTQPGGTQTGGTQPGGTQPVGTRPAGSSPAAPDTSFHSSQPPFVPQQLAARLGKTPQERQYIEGVLTKCLNFYTDTAKQKGVPLNDVARALNYYISTNYYIYSQGREPTPDQMSATRDLIRANMVQDEAFLRMTDTQKQEAYETLIVLAGFVDLGYGTAKNSGDANAAGQFREMAIRNLETLLGAPIAKIHFTSEGLTLN